MKEYKVIYVAARDYADIGKIYDSDYTWSNVQDIRRGQEDVLNYYAKQGWRLVQSCLEKNDEVKGSIFLYLERDI